MAELEIGKNALHVLEKRYLAKDATGKLIEDVPGMFRRVAVAVAAADARYDERSDIVSTAEEFYALMTSLRFLPNSPTLMNAGRPLGQLSACFVLPVEDSMEGIFETVKQAALIHKSGGGTGFSFSRLRQNGAPVNSTGGVASGPISFMRVFNMATEAVKQGGTRRGANMGILRVDHPDIEDFIHCKSVNTDITNFNISVGITEAFMRAVESGDDYDLIDPKTKKIVGRKNAKQLFDDIVDASWNNGEPGIIFLDRLNRDNVVPVLGEIESTNPCGEQPLLPYESCNLGSMNLVKMLRRVGESDWEIDYGLLRKTIHEAVHFLDNIIDINTYPIEKIGEVTRETRKIGLGVMGFADMLLHLGVPYNSDDAVELAENLMAFINIEGHNASKELARTRGAFPLFYSSIYARETPLRNGTVTTIAPTGTLSMIGSCSSGVEPVFAYVYIRNIMDGTQMAEVSPVLKTVLEQRGLYTEELMCRIAKEGTLAHITELPEDIRRVFVCAHDITPEFHIRMQAAFQHSTDNAVSKTINLSHNATRGDVTESYFLAYHLGCKGVTIYRDGSRGGQVLNIGSVKQDAASAQTTVPAVSAALDTASLTLPTEQAIVATLQPRPRPPVTIGFTERMKIGCGNLYVTVNYDENGICEVFTSTGKAGGCPSQSEATARLASVALRSGISVDEVYDQLKGIRCPSTIRQTGMSCTSCPDAIAKVLRKVDAFIKDKNGSKRAAPAPEPLTARRAAPLPLEAAAQEHSAVPQPVQAATQGNVQDVSFTPVAPVDDAKAAQGAFVAQAEPAKQDVADATERATQEAAPHNAPVPVPVHSGAPIFAAGEDGGASPGLGVNAAVAPQVAPFADEEVDPYASHAHAAGWKIPLTGLDTMPDELRNPYAPARETKTQDAQENATVVAPQHPAAAQAQAAVQAAPRMSGVSSGHSAQPGDVNGGRAAAMPVASIAPVVPIVPVVPIAPVVPVAPAATQRQESAFRAQDAQPVGARAAVAVPTAAVPAQPIASASAPATAASTVASTAASTVASTVAALFKAASAPATPASSAAATPTAAYTGKVQAPLATRATPSGGNTASRAPVPSAAFAAQAAPTQSSAPLQNYFGDTPPPARHAQQQGWPVPDTLYRMVPNSIATPPAPEPAPQGGYEGTQANPATERLAAERLAAVPAPRSASEIHRCPECDGPVEHEGGCVVCRNCGFSKCG